MSATSVRRAPDAAQVLGGVKVLFLGGQARSGSTLLDRMLGQIDGVCSVGEVRYLFARGLAAGELCGCGTPLGSCEFWQRVGDEAFGGWDRIDLGEVLWLQREVDTPAQIPKLLAPRLDREFEFMFRRYTDYLERVFRGIQAASGASVLVDSTMSPPYALALRAADGIDLRVVHLVRDARGVAFSSSKRVQRPEATAGTDYMPVYSPRESALRWVGANLVFEALARSVPTIRVLYEEFVRDPETELRRVTAHAGIEMGDLPFLRNRHLELGVGHTAAGNPMRFQTGRVELRDDDGWRHDMRPKDRRLVTALAWPMLGRYGYLRTTAPGRGVGELA